VSAKSTAKLSNAPEMDAQLHQASCFCGAVHVETTGQVCAIPSPGSSSSLLYYSDA